MAKKLRLQIDHTDSFSLLALSSTLKNYKIAFQINQFLQLDLKRREDFLYKAEKSASGNSYAFFSHRIKDSNGYICLLQNRHPEGFLLPLYRQADYFLIFYESPTKELFDEYLKLLKKTSGILAAFPIDNPPAKSVEQFFQDLELHIMEQNKN